MAQGDSRDNPFEVTGEPANQAGFAILKAYCPRCGHQFGLHGPEFRQCSCGVWIKVNAPAPGAKAPERGPFDHPALPPQKTHDEQVAAWSKKPDQQ